MSDGTLLPALGLAAGLATLLGAVLGLVASRLRTDADSLVERIDATAGPNWMPAARDREPRS